MMMRSKSMCAVAVLAAAALMTNTSPVNAQDAAQEAKLRASMSASAYVSFAAAIQDARGRGLPTEPLIVKGLEGAAKNVPGDRITVAVRGLAQKMVRAQVILRSNRPATSAEIIAVADALQRNVPEDAIRKLTADAGGRATITLTAYALADLLGHGVPLAVGTDVIGAWRAQGAEAARLKEIPAAIERLVRQGVAPARAGAGVAAGLRLNTPLSRITPLNLPN